MNAYVTTKRTKKNKTALEKIIKNKDLYIMLLPAVAIVFIFSYIPMYGVLIAFKDYSFQEGVMGSTWIGFHHFKRFFSSYYFGEIIRNTVSLSVYQLVAGFPAPIIFALALNQINMRRYKKIVQTVTYAPHFISTIVLVGMINVFISPRNGMINQIITTLGSEPIFFAAESSWFRTLYVFSGIWQNMGWSAIVYLAALSGVDPMLKEAAMIDGAGKLKRLWYIDIPAIIPTMTILLILGLGDIMSVGFQKAYLMQTPLNLEKSEIIATFVYKVGLLDHQYSFSTAVNLFDTIINLVLLLIINKVAKKVTETSLW